MKPSLWDLKHAVVVLRWAGGEIMKPSLWDLKLLCGVTRTGWSVDHEAIPMGFETLPVLSFWETSPPS